MESNLEAWNPIGQTSVVLTRARAFPRLVSVYRLGATKHIHGQICQRTGAGGLYMHHGSSSSNDTEFCQHVLGIQYADRI
jgi:hypothetical protein